MLEQSGIAKGSQHGCKTLRVAGGRRDAIRGTHSNVCTPRKLFFFLFAHRRGRVEEK
jgi:hypothetical protein